MDKTVDGQDSMAHLGLTWQLPIFDTPIYLEGTFGAAVHNGALTGAGPGPFSPPIASSGNPGWKPRTMPGPPPLGFATAIGSPTGNPERESQSTTRPEQRGWLPGGQSVWVVAM